MRRTFMKAKIHRATVTDSQLHYMGSITIDRALCEATDILPYEQVQVLNLDNGSRIETYVIEGKRGSGQIQVNGAAARWFAKNDRVIIIAYTELEAGEIAGFQPRIAFVDNKNKLSELKIDTIKPYPVLPRAKKAQKRVAE